MSERPTARPSSSSSSPRRLGVILVDPLPVVRAGTAAVDRRPSGHGSAGRGGRRRPGRRGDHPGPPDPRRGAGRTRSLRRARCVLVDPDAPPALSHARDPGVRRELGSHVDQPGLVRGRRRLRGQEHRPGRVPAVAPARGRPRDGAGDPRVVRRSDRSSKASSAVARWRSSSRTASARCSWSPLRDSPRGRSRPVSACANARSRRTSRASTGSSVSGSRLAAIRMASQSGLVSVGASE